MNRFGLLVVIALTSLEQIAHAAQPSQTLVTSAAARPVALITGSDRGIGFALTQELVARGWKVIATCRDPEHAQALHEFAATHPLVSIEDLDVTSASTIDALAAKYKGQTIDVLINNAGIGFTALPRAGALDADEFQRAMLVNAYGPLRVSGAFVEQIAASRQRKIIAITSAISSLSEAPQATLAYSYVVSKAAMNMGMRLLQNEVRDRGIIVTIVTPGPVATDMRRASEAAQARTGSITPLTMPELTPAESARTLATFIETMGPDKAGGFYTYNGKAVPW